MVGNRFDRLEGRALKKLNAFGNRLINRVFSTANGVHLTDILSGYRAFTTEGVRYLDLFTAGFEIESEMTIESIKKGLEMIEVPITLPEAAGTKTKLNPFKDGLKIILTIYRMARPTTPCFTLG